MILGGMSMALSMKLSQPYEMLSQNKRARSPDRKPEEPKLLSKNL